MHIPPAAVPQPTSWRCPSDCPLSSQRTLGCRGSSWFLSMRGRRVEGAPLASGSHCTSASPRPHGPGPGPAPAPTPTPTPTPTPAPAPAPASAPAPAPAPAPWLTRCDKRHAHYVAARGNARARVVQHARLVGDNQLNGLGVATCKHSTGGISRNPRPSHVVSSVGACTRRTCATQLAETHCCPSPSIAPVTMGLEVSPDGQTTRLLPLFLRGPFPLVAGYRYQMTTACAFTRADSDGDINTTTGDPPGLTSHLLTAHCSCAPCPGHDPSLGTTRPHPHPGQGPSRAPVPSAAVPGPPLNCDEAPLLDTANTA
jgi:hypothetical protein